MHNEASIYTQQSNLNRSDAAVSRNRAQNIAQDVGKAHTAEISAPHENHCVTNAIVKDTIALNAYQELFRHL